MKSPTPEQIRQARETAKLSRKDFGRLIYSTERAVKSWECGERPMHPGLWDLARAKIMFDAVGLKWPPTDYPDSVRVTLLDIGGPLKVEWLMSHS